MTLSAPPAIAQAALAQLAAEPGVPLHLTRNAARGEAYRDYQRHVSKFVPMPPKARGHDV